VSWTPLEYGFYWTILALIVAGAALSAANLVHARWTARRLGVQIGLDTIGIILVVLMLPTPLMEIAAASGADAGKAAVFTYWANVSWRITLGAAGIILLARVVVGIRRAGRVNAASPAAAAS
jgi:hypothetical protein